MGGTQLLAALMTVAALVGGSPVVRIGPNPQAADRAVEAAIQETLQQYSAALANLDALAVKRVQPSIDVDTLRTAFKEMRTLEVMIEDVRILSSETATARVSCRVTQTLTPKAGTKKTTTVTRVIRFRRQEGGWVIDAFER